MAAFTPWTRIFFKNAAAPTGWIKDTSVTYDHGLRIVSSTLGSPASIPQKNTQPFTNTMVNVTLPANGSFTGVGVTDQAEQDVPFHTHPAVGTGWTSTVGTALTYYASGYTNPISGRVISRSTDNRVTGGAGGGSLHSHPVTLNGVYTQTSNINFAVKYADLLLAYKDDTATPKRIFSLVTPTSVNEGDTTSFTVNTVNVPDGTVLTWNFINVSLAVLPNITKGNFVINNNTGNFSFVIPSDNITTGSNYFQIELIYVYYQSSILLSPLITINDTATEWFISTDNTALANGLNEGSSLILYYTLAPNSSLIGYWRIKLGGTGGVLSNAADFASAISGSVGPKALTTDTNTYPINIPITSDYLTEGVENFAIECSDTSDFAIIKFTSPNYKINDSTTGTGGSVTFTSVPASVNEGATVSFNISTSAFPSGYTGLYWTINHSTTSAADFVATSGSITLSGTTGSFTISPTADLTTEGPETFTVSIRNGGITGSILATSSAVTINDTSTTPLQIQFTAPGTYSWIAPLDVTSVCVLCVGAGGNGGSANGGGGGGGGLVYANNIPVTPGTTYTLQVGTGGGGPGFMSNEGLGASWFKTPQYLFATTGDVGTTGTWGTGGGGGGAAGYVGIGGTGGGQGYPRDSSRRFIKEAGGGGYWGGTATGVAGGLGGAGGTGWTGSTSTIPATNGTNGAGAGGSGATYNSKGGGGVGIFGQSSVDNNGAPTTPGIGIDRNGNGAFRTNGGSGGESAIDYSGGRFGGGGAGAYSGTGGRASGGAVRIIWGAGRAFPSTNTGNI